MESRQFRMGGMQFVAEMIFRYAGKLMLFLSATAVLGIVLGVTVDFTWFFAALMIVFIVLPLLVAFLYYYIGLRRECFINTTIHTLNVCSQGIGVRMMFPVGDDQQDNDQELDEESQSCFESERYNIREEFFPYSQMESVRIGVKSVVIPFRSPLKGFIWIPADAFSTPEALGEVLDMIETHVTESCRITENI